MSCNPSSLLPISSSQKPCALVLVGASDSKRCFHGKPFEYSLEHISKTHRVYVSVIGAFSNMKEYIRSCKQQFHIDKVDVLVLAGHGSASSIRFGKGEKKEDFYLEQDVTSEDFQEIEETGTIILDSCHTGKSLAPKIASIQPRPVVAPLSSSIYNQSSLFNCCKEHGLTMVCNSSEQYIEMSQAIFKKESFGVVIRKSACDPQKMQKEYFQERHLWYLERAEKGCADSQYELGEGFREGLGVEVDPVKSFYWLEKAACANHLQAQYSLGLCYLAGYGTIKNMEKAVELFTKAASMEHVESYHALGLCFKHGYGVKQDFEMANAWFVKAAKCGDKEAEIDLLLLQKERCARYTSLAYKVLKVLSQSACALFSLRYVFHRIIS